MLRIKAPADTCYGLALMAMGLLGLWLGSNLRVGTSMAMGPGFLPRMLSYAMIGLGCLIAARSFVVDGPALERWSIRPLLAIGIAVAFFAFAIRPLGLPVAVFGSVLIGSLGDRAARWYEAVLLGVGLAVASTLLFVTALGLPMRILPWG
jgi:hypothetical protein